MRQGQLVQERFYSGIGRNKWAKIGLQVLLIIGFSALTAIAKRAHPSIGIPSSSAPFWLSAMVIARSTVRRNGAGVLIGVGTAFWCIPLGLAQSFTQNLVSFALAGAFLDIMTMLPRVNILRWWGAALCALMANMAQFAIIIYFALSATVVRRFMIVGMLESVLLHIGFGIAAGLIGWAVFRGVRYGFQRLI